MPSLPHLAARQRFASPSLACQATSPAARRCIAAGAPAGDVLRGAAAGLVGLVLLLLAVIGPAPALAQSAPVPHRIGLLLTDLHGFDLARGTFGASFWIWSTGPEAQRALHSMEFTNAERISVQLDNTRDVAGTTWSQRKVTGHFREPWALRAFPFDRHVLEIILEEGVEESRRFVYTLDAANSGFALREPLEGWRVRDLRILADSVAYPSNFGDPDQTTGESSFARLRAVIELERTDLTGFAKLTAALYAGVLICVLGCLVPINSLTFGTRITVLVASLFAIVLNMRSASAALGSEDGLTLIDALHVAGLLYVATIVAVTIVVRRRFDGIEQGTESAPALARFDHRACLAAALLFMATNVAVLLAAEHWR